ncbi:MAG: hypothetical protein K2K92_03470, partial [Duncaniella sp.]|nr:hypothetical protein [Duncaniella sp.]
WHIWVTDYNPATEQRVISDGTTTVRMFARDMGRIIGDDVTNFPDCKVKVRFTQTDVPEGKEPLSRTVELEQTGAILTTGDSFTLYQWGRKDPIIGHENRWYNASHEVFENILTEDCNTLPTGTALLDDFIKSPQIMWTADHTHTFTYTNMWNSGRSSTSSIKTVYDPSPVGYKVPVGTVLNHIANDASATVTHLATAEGNRKAGFYITQTDGNVIYFPDLGYRAGRDGSEQSYGISGEWWICSGNRTEARAIVLSVDTGGTVTKRTTTEPRTHALGVIPEQE